MEPHYPFVGYVFLSMWDLYFSLCGICISHFPIEFLHLGIIWASSSVASLSLSCPQIRLIGGATFYKAPKTPNKPFIVYLQHPIGKYVIDLESKDPLGLDFNMESLSGLLVLSKNDRHDWNKFGIFGWPDQFFSWIGKFKKNTENL